MKFFKNLKQEIRKAKTVKTLKILNRMANRYIEDLPKNIDPKYKKKVLLDYKKSKQLLIKKEKK